jgi:hypothetical protein
MEHDGPFAAPELGPGEHRGAEIDGGGVDDFDGRSLPGLLGQLGGNPLVQLVVSPSKTTAGRCSLASARVERGTAVRPRW